MREISGKVAKLLDQHSLIVNRGINHGVKMGDIVAVTQDVHDPVSGDILGGYERLRLKVTDTHPQFCIAETYRLTHRTSEQIVTVNVGDDVDWLEL